jgi:hypothetical protein
MKLRFQFGNRWLLLAVLGRDALSRGFWRLSAHLLAFALRYRSGLAHALPWLRFTVAGLAAFVLGRVIGGFALP